MSSTSVLTAAVAAMLLAAAASAQTTPPPKTTDSGTPADAASSATTSMNRGSGTTSDDNGVTSMGAEAARGSTASGNAVMSASEMRDLDKCRAVPKAEQTRSSLCKRLQGKHPSEFNPDGTVRDTPR
ncbi:MAG: hypothetical protein JO111_13130 [Caulobacteraceae bacterium]|nr:hypothetical protein [Caulobacteraceae bacterium]